MAKNTKDNKNSVGDDSKNFSLLNSRHQKKLSLRSLYINNSIAINPRDVEYILLFLGYSTTITGYLEDDDRCVDCLGDFYNSNVNGDNFKSIFSYLNEIKNKLLPDDNIIGDLRPFKRTFTNIYQDYVELINIKFHSAYIIAYCLDAYQCHTQQKIGSFEKLCSIFKYSRDFNFRPYKQYVFNPFISLYISPSNEFYNFLSSTANTMIKIGRVMKN